MSLDWSMNKLCNKGHPCGRRRSLGGHMRSHAADAPPEADEAVDNTVKLASLCDYSYDEDEEEEEQVDEDSMVEEAKENASYELRPNSRKKKEAEALAGTKKFVCVKCGKGFQSQKAMCGHMACHSDKDKSLNKLSAHPSKNNSSWFNQKVVMDSHSDTETGAPPAAAAAAGSSGPNLRKRSKRVKYKNSSNLAGSKSSFSVPNFNGGSSVSMVENEQEEVAECLMMLSRGSGKWDGLNSVGKNSSDLSVRLEDSSETFMSPPTPDLSKGKGKTGRNCGSKHECLVCLKGFRSGQALGGHKRIHLTGGSIELKPINEQVPLQDPCHTCIDLNQPAPVEDHEFMPW